MYIIKLTYKLDSSETTVHQLIGQ